MAPHLPYAERLRIVELWKAGHTQAKIREFTGHTRPTIALWIRRALDTGTVTANKRVSYKRATTSEQDDGIRNRHSQDPYLPLKTIAAEFNVSAKTVWRRLYRDKKRESPDNDDSFDASECVEIQMDDRSTTPEDNSRPNMCRICLHSFSKLISIEAYGLSSAYEQLTGVSVQHDDGLPQELCVECATLLNKYHRFRGKSIKGNQILRQLYAKDGLAEKIPPEDIDQVINNLASNLEFSCTFVCVEIKPTSVTQIDPSDE